MTKRVPLKNFYLFRGMGKDDLAVVEGCAERKQCGPSELIFREGEKRRRCMSWNSAPWRISKPMAP